MTPPKLRIREWRQRGGGNGTEQYADLVSNALGGKSNWELSVLNRQCLDRRIGDWDTLRQEIAAWTRHRNQPACKINWRFTTDEARVKLKKLYPAFDD